MSGWVFPACDLCGGTAGTDILRLPHADAPGGAAFIRECRGCGLKRLWPRPGPDIIQRYYAADYEAYLGRQRSRLKQALWDLWRDGASKTPQRSKALRLLNPLFQIAGDYLFDINVSLDREVPPRILDIGCGFGDLLIYWQSRGADVLGIDFEARAVAMAKKNNVTVIHGNVLDVNIMPGSFDVAVLNHSLEHFQNPLSVLKKCLGVLKPHGELHLAVPNIAGVFFDILGRHWEGLSFPVHFWFFEPDTIIALLRKAGFHTFNLWTKYPHQFFFSRLRHTSGLITRGDIFRPARGDTLKAIASA